MVEEQVISLNPVVEVPGPSFDELEEAANLLLSQLQVPDQEFLVEIADFVLHIPKWHLVCGLLVAELRGNTATSPMLDGSWKWGVAGASSKQCSICQVEFTPTRLGQEVCGEKCGVERDKRAKEKRDEQLKAEIEASKSTPEAIETESLPAPY